MPLPDDGAVSEAVADAPPDIDAHPDAYVPACGTTVLFADELADTTAAPLFTSGSGAGLTVTESGGHIDVAFAASVPANSYGYYISGSTYASEGLCVALEVSQVPAGDAIVYFKLRSSTFEAELMMTAGALAMRTRNPALVTHQTIAFDPTQHRFWRLRQQSGTTYWDTAPDGVSYVEQASVTGVFTPATTSVDFGAGAYVDTPNGGTARFERVVAHGP